MNEKFLSKQFTPREIFLVIVISVFVVVTLVSHFNLFAKIFGNASSHDSLSSTTPISASGIEEGSGGGAQVRVTTNDPAISDLIAKIFKHIFLPSGQVIVETVVKPDDLRKANPVFYQFVKLGDKILIYSDRAILYDPVADKVLDIIHGKN